MLIASGFSFTAWALQSTVIDSNAHECRFKHNLFALNVGKY